MILCSISIDRAFIFNKRNKNKKGSGGKKKFKWGKKKTKGSSKFASTELPVIEEEEQKREQDVDATDGTFDDATEKRVSRCRRRWQPVHSIETLLPKVPGNKETQPTGCDAGASIR